MEHTWRQGGALHMTRTCATAEWQAPPWQRPSDGARLAASGVNSFRLVLTAHAGAPRAAPQQVALRHVHVRPDVLHVDRQALRHARRVRRQAHQRQRVRARRIKVAQALLHLACQVGFAA